MSKSKKLNADVSVDVMSPNRSRRKATLDGSPLIRNTAPGSFKEAIDEIREQMRTTLEEYNRSKADAKHHYTKLQHLRGALDVLESLARSFELVQK